MKKSYKHIYHSPLHVCYYRKHPNNELRFGRYHLLASNSTFMTDSQYLGTIQTWRNLNEDRYYSTSTKSIIYTIDANCFPFQPLDMLAFHTRLEHIKPIYSNVFKYHFKTGNFASFSYLHMY